MDSVRNTGRNGVKSGFGVVSGALKQDSVARFTVTVAGNEGRRGTGAGRVASRDWCSAALGGEWMRWIRCGSRLAAADSIVGERGMRGGWRLAELLTSGVGADVRHVAQWTTIVDSGAHEEATVGGFGRPELAPGSES